MFRRLAFLLVSALLFSVNSSAQTVNRNKDKKWHGLGIEVRFGLIVAPKLIGEVHDIPLSLRTLPKHPDDWWFSTPNNMRVIPFNLMGISRCRCFDDFHASYGEIAVMPQFYFNDRFGLRAGVTLSGDHDKTYTSYWAVNQNGEPYGGTGTSLVYYSLIYQRGVSIEPVIEIEYNPIPEIGFIGGYTTSRDKFVFQNGYERWGSQEPYTTFEFARNKVQWPYMGLRFAWKAGEKNGYSKGGLLFLFGPEKVNSRINIKDTARMNIKFYQNKFRFGLYFTVNGSRSR